MEMYYCHLQGVYNTPIKPSVFNSFVILLPLHGLATIDVYTCTWNEHSDGHYTHRILELGAYESIVRRETILLLYTAVQ